MTPFVTFVRRWNWTNLDLRTSDRDTEGVLTESELDSCEVPRSKKAKV